MGDDVPLSAFLAFVEMISQNIFVAAGKHPFDIFFNGRTNEIFMIAAKLFPIVREYLLDGIFSSDSFQHIGVD